MSPELFFYAPILLLPTLVLVCLLHGGLISLLAMQNEAYRQVINCVSAHIVSAFFLSIFINGIIIIAFSFIGVHIKYTVVCLLLLDCLLIGWLYLKRASYATRFQSILPKAQSLILLIIVLFMFMMMMHSGGLLDSLADGWWHMSMTQKIISEGSVFYLNHHLHGAQADLFSVDYPFLWHANLALVYFVSGLSLPVIWHAVAAFLVAMALLAYFLLARAISSGFWVAVLSVALFCVLYGGINSYFRVMPWPGNVSYIGLYFALAIFINQFSVYLEETKPSDFSALNSQKTKTTHKWVAAFLVFVTLVSMLLIHGVAAALFGVAIAFFTYATVLNYLFNGVMTRPLFGLLGVLLVVAGVGVFVAQILFPAHILSAVDKIEQISIIFVLLLLAPMIIAFVVGKGANKSVKRLGCLLISVCFLSLLLLAADWSHLLRLFDNNELDLMNRLHVASSLLSENLLLPKWEHQLKSGILLSGGFAVLLSVLLLFTKKSIGLLFLVSNALFAFFALISPEFFRVLELAIYSSSAYRVQVLIFAPIIYAIAIKWCLEQLFCKQPKG